MAQRPAQTAPPAPVPADTSQNNISYITLAIGGFIPMSESYRLNYSTKLVGIPVEVNGGFVFPIGKDMLFPFTARYIRRVGNFASSTTIQQLSIEPGVRFYFEKERPKDLRIFGAVEALFAQAHMEAVYDVSVAGEDTSTALALKNYYNIGLGFDIGIAYPLTETTAVDGVVHAGLYFIDPVTHGGLGNIGGISLSVAYRFGF